MFLTKVVEKIKMHILRSITFFSAVYEVWKNIAEPGRPQVTIWRKCVICWIPTATDTHSQHVVITDFPLQQRLCCYIIQSKPDATNGWLNPTAAKIFKQNYYFSSYITRIETRDWLYSTDYFTFCNKSPVQLNTTRFWRCCITYNYSLLVFDCLHRVTDIYTLKH